MDFQGLAETRAQAGNNDPETLRKVAGQFEALFLQMMLKSMRDASLGEGIMDSDHSKTYQGMFDRQVAMDLSQGNGIGLADMIVRQLSGSPLGVEAEGQPLVSLDERQPMALLTFDATDRVRAIVPLEPEERQDWMPGSAEEFVRDLVPMARQAAADLGVDPEVLVAQAALETGWGRRMIRGSDGQNSFNLFGIKADTGWQGRKVFSHTVEFREGLMRRERAAFRAYATLEDSFNDYVDFLRSNPRYREVLNSVADNQSYTAALQRAGYATDPEYASKINRILRSEVVSPVKENGALPIT